MAKIEDFDILFKQMADTYLSQYGLNWIHLKAQAIAESKLNPKAVSKAGAIGLMQIMPATGEELGYSVPELLNPEKNIEAGARYMAGMMRFWDLVPKWERWFFALASYNAGPGNILTARKLAERERYNSFDWSCVSPFLHKVTGPFAKETINYVARVKRIYHALRSEYEYEKENKS